MRRQSGHKHDDCCALARLREDIDGSRGVDNSFRYKALVLRDLSTFYLPHSYSRRDAQTVSNDNYTQLTFTAYVM